MQSGFVRTNWVIGHRKKDINWFLKQVGDIRGRCIDIFEFFHIPLDETIANTYILKINSAFF